MTDVAIVGAGVIGLSCARRLAGDATVDLYYDRPLLESTSANATAIWHVYLVDPDDERNLRWSAQTLDALVAISGQEPASGVELRPGVELFISGTPVAPSWSEIAIDFLMLDVDQMRDFPGRSWGYSLRAPTANMHTYLSWLMDDCRSRGVRFHREAVGSLDLLTERYDVVVNCAGLRSRDLVEDDELYPVRGQYLAFGLVDGLPAGYIGDDEHPDGMAYFIIRDGELLIGGTEEPDVWSLDWSAEESEMVSRATQFLPDVDVSQLVLRRRVVDLRPCRRSRKVRFGRDEDNPRILHNYGHGGSGFSLAWGCADDIADLVFNHH